MNEGTRAVLDLESLDVGDVGAELGNVEEAFQEEARRVQGETKPVQRVRVRDLG